MAVYFHLPHIPLKARRKIKKMIFENAFMSILDFELTNSDNASASTTGFSRPMPMSAPDLQSLPKTADVVRMELVGLSFNQIEICWLCNNSNSLAGKAFFSHEQQNKTTIFDFDGYKFFTRSQSNSSLDTFDELLRI